MGFVNFAQVKERVSIETVYPLLGLTMKQVSPDQWRGPCPVCRAGGDRAIVVTKSKAAFYCFGAKTGGDVIALAAHIKGLAVKDAAQFLVGTPPEEQTRGMKEVSRNFQPPAVNLEEILKTLDVDHEECGKLGLSADTLHFFGAGYKKAGVGRGNVLAQLHDGQGVLKGYFSLGDPWFPKDIVPGEFIFNAHRLIEGEVRILASPLEVMKCYEFTQDTQLVAPLTPTLSPLQFKFLSLIFEEKNCVAVI